MVPMDVPEVALDMISRFLRGDSFVSGFSPLGSAVHAPIDAAECGRGGVGRVVGALSTDPNKRSQPHHRSSPGTSPGNHLRHLLQTKISEISDEFDNTTLVSN